MALTSGLHCKANSDPTRLQVLLGHLDDREVGQLGLDLFHLRADLLVLLVLLDVHRREGLPLILLVGE